MTPSALDRNSFLGNRRRLLIALGLAAAIALIGIGGSWVSGTGDPDPEAIAGGFRQFGERAVGVAGELLESPTWQTAARLRRQHGARLEGLGVVDGAGRFVTWEGSPAQPPADFVSEDSADVRLHDDGVRVRLIARAGPDTAGRFGLATFLVRSAPDELEAVDLLPRVVVRNARIDFDFLDSRDDRSRFATEPPGMRGTPGSGIRIALSSPDGAMLGMADVQTLDEAFRSRRLGRQILAWLILALIVAVAAAIRWNALLVGLSGALAALGAIGLARAILILADVPAVLLPRHISGPVDFGTDALAGLLASPVDLLLSGAALFLLARVVDETVQRQFGRRRSLARGLAAGLALAASLGAVWLAWPLARDTELPLLEAGALYAIDTRLLILVGWSLAVLAAGRLWASVWADGRGRSGRPAMFAAILVTAWAAGALLGSQAQAVAVERLRTEFAPMTLEQRSRRVLALEQALRHVADSYSDVDRAPQAGAGPPERLAYQFWAGGELAHAGLKSSLAFYTARGDRVSHFAFDLPEFQEAAPDPVPEPGEVVLFDESVDLVIAYRTDLIHGEIAVTRGSESLGSIVGHVLDDPTNLPFLPWSRPYFAALGGDSVMPRGAGGSDPPDYVLYDGTGKVLVTTLPSPPGQDERLRVAAAGDERVLLSAGNEAFVGLPLLDGAQMHLLMIPALTWLDRLAPPVRLSILSLVLLALLGAIPLAIRPRTWLRQLRQLRRSFYRKLLAATLIASILPIAGLGLFLRGYVARRGDEAIANAATQAGRMTQRILEDYLATPQELRDDGSFVPAIETLDDNVLHWLRRLVGQEVHVYADGALLASSKRELFSSGMLSPRLDGEVHRRLIDEGLPNLVQTHSIGPSRIPVAFAALRNVDPRLQLVVAVPSVVEQSRIERAVDRLGEVILLSTLLLVGLVALAGAWLARTVARPVRELVAATGRIAAGDYATRLVPRTEDEVAELVGGFNSMAAALSRQRADLEQRREYMERLLRHATTGVLSTDTEGRIVTLNPAARSLLVEAGEGLHPGNDLVETLAHKPPLRPLATALRQGAAAGGAPIEVDLGRDEPCRMRFVRIALRDRSGEVSGTLLLFDDVTDLMRSNQLAAWAEMARSIAHEIKNPLTPIQLSAEHLRRILQDLRVLPSEAIESCLEAIIKQVRSLREIAGEFSSFSTIPDLSREPGEAVALMREVAAPYRAGSPPGIEIVEEYPDDAPAISIDRTVLSRALVNLIENALQAMPDGGRLTVGVETGADGSELALIVSDTGSGLDPEVRRRLFEPYFSTKSSGTGLGLAIVRRTVEAHQGRIDVDSQPGKGTTFRIVLPVAQPPQIPRPVYSPDER